jgi:hypothetical protein
MGRLGNSSLLRTVVIERREGNKNVVLVSLLIITIVNKSMVNRP